MKPIKLLKIPLVVIFCLILFVVFFSSTLSNYECTGTISRGIYKEPKTLFIVHEKYRWWIGLWGESDGNIRLEIPSQHVNYYGHLEEVGLQVQIYNYSSKLEGSFSTLSKVLTLKTPYGFFEGKCVSIK